MIRLNARGRMGKKKCNKSLKLKLHRANDRCYYCNLTTDLETETPDHPRLATVDHRLPLSRGGSRVGPNAVLACFRCNHYKGDMTEEEFWRWRKAKMLGASNKDALRIAKVS